MIDLCWCKGGHILISKIVRVDFIVILPTAGVYLLLLLCALSPEYGINLAVASVILSL